MLQQGNLYTHISHCPGVNKNLVRGVILAVYFLNAYAVLVCSLKPTAKGEGQSSSRFKTWTTGYFDTRRRANGRGYKGSPDFTDVTLVLNDEDQGVSSPLAETYGYSCQHGGKRRAAVSKP